MYGKAHAQQIRKPQDCFKKHQDLTLYTTGSLNQPFLANNLPLQGGNYLFLNPGHHIKGLHIVTLICRSSRKLVVSCHFSFFEGSTCDQPTSPHGSTIIHPTQREKYQNGQVILFGCKQGFYLDGMPIITCNGNKWTQTQFRCLGIS